MKKKFNTFKFQQKVREELSAKYTANREVFLRELKKEYSNLKKLNVNPRVSDN